MSHEPCFLQLSYFSPLLFSVLGLSCPPSLCHPHLHTPVTMASMSGEHLNRNCHWSSWDEVFTHSCPSDLLKSVDINFLFLFPWENIYIVLNGLSLLLSCCYCYLQIIIGKIITTITITNSSICLNWSLRYEPWEPGALTSEYSMSPYMWHSPPTYGYPPAACSISVHGNIFINLWKIKLNLLIACKYPFLNKITGNSLRKRCYR